MKDDGPLLKRTRAFALSVIRLVELLPSGRTTDVLGRQLLRSATSVGANYRSACRAKSKADFINKLAIVEEEADECSYWLGLMADAKLVQADVTANLAIEADEITAMVVASIRSTRRGLHMGYSALRTPNSALSSVSSTRGVTLIELMMTLVIGSIAFFAVAVPFVAERSFSASGRRQTEAQRDAQLALRAMARVARQSTSYAIAAGGAQITFSAPGGGSPSCFRGGPSFGNQLQRYSAACGTGSAAILIDGNRSRVTSLAMISITGNLVRAQVQVTHQNQRTETLATNLFLRNAPATGGSGDNSNNQQDGQNGPNDQNGNNNNNNNNNNGP